MQRVMPGRRASQSSAGVRIGQGKPLSEKELEILHWAKRGKTVWEISVIRSISQATVKYHLANIYAKLQVSNRAQAVGEAARRGMLR